MDLTKSLKKVLGDQPVISFSFIIILTIAVSRCIVYYVADPNFLLFNLELHHFD